MSVTSGSMYTDGSYLEMTGGTWHEEDAPFKARWILKMLGRHPEVSAGRVCEIGCGAGGILAELQRALPAETVFTGYEISPQAHALSARYANGRCRFVLGDGLGDEERHDLVLVMDVVEHVEDSFGFLRQTREKGRWKIYHIPLDVHVLGVLLGVTNTWEEFGHIHRYSLETALKTLEQSGLRVLDWMLTDVAMGGGNPSLRRRLGNLIRRPLGMVSQEVAARLLGGYSVLVLAE